MLNIGGYDLEFQTINREPVFGYVDEYREYKMLSGKVRRDVKGKRFSAEFTYAYLTDTQIGTLLAIQSAYKSAGYVAAEITMPSMNFSGDVHFAIENSQARFHIDDAGVAIWKNWQILLTGVDLV